MFKVTFTVTNRNPNTIWNKLAKRLGREPSHAEAVAEVERILTENAIDMASKGKLQFQRKRR